MQHSSLLQQQKKEDLAGIGLKGTKPRLAILSLLEQESRPLDVAEILALLRGEQIEINQATVYRILDLFYEKGIVNRFEFQEGKFRYELTGAEHHHLICEVCGRIEDISDCNISELEEEIRKKKHFTVKRHALEFFGVCQQCQS